MTDTCKGCEHGTGYRCSHPEKQARPTYSLSPDGNTQIPAESCEYYHTGELPEPQQPVTDDQASQVDHQTLLLSISPDQSPEDVEADIARFNARMTELLANDYQPHQFASNGDQGGLMVLQTMIRMD